MIDREGLPDCAAGRVAHEMRPLDAEMVHQLQQVIGHLIDGIVDAGSAALAGAAMIMGDDLMLLREGLDIRIPVGADSAEARDQEDRRASSMRFVKDLDVAQIGFRHGCTAPFPRTVLFVEHGHCADRRAGASAPFQRQADEPEFALARSALPDCTGSPCA